MNNLEYLKKYVKKEELDNAIKRLDEGEPVQYIIGNVNFYGNPINVNKSVLIPRFETEELVEKTINKIRKKFDKTVHILDLCTGSGCIAITLKKELACTVVASDISKEALEVARGNALQNDVNIQWIHSNLFENINGKFDVLISNPPYISYDEKIDEIVYNNEPHLALFADNEGLFFYEEILKRVNDYLNEKFIIAFEIGCTQGDEIVSLVYQYLKNVRVTVEKDLQGRNRFLFIESK